MHLRARMHKFSQMIVQYEKETAQSGNFQVHRVHKMAKACGFYADTKYPLHCCSRKANAFRNEKPRISRQQRKRWRLGKQEKVLRSKYGTLYIRDIASNNHIASMSYCNWEDAPDNNVRSAPLPLGSRIIKHLTMRSVAGRKNTSLYFYAERILISYGSTWPGSHNPDARVLYPTELFLYRDTNACRNYKLYTDSNGHNIFNGKPDAQKAYERLPHKMKQFEWYMLGG